jgi:hypothetical protein
MSYTVALLLALSGARPNPCSLLTATEVRAALGVAVPAEQPQREAAGAVSCNWVGPADQTLRLVVYPGGAPAYEAYLRQATRAWGGARRTVRGAGDRAVFLAGQMVVLRGPWFFTLSLNHPADEGARLRRSSLLAQRIARRIQ